MKVRAGLGRALSYRRLSAPTSISGHCGLSGIRRVSGVRANSRSGRSDPTPSAPSPIRGRQPGTCGRPALGWPGCQGRTAENRALSAAPYRRSPGFSRATPLRGIPRRCRVRSRVRPRGPPLTRSLPSAGHAGRMTRCRVETTSAISACRTRRRTGQCWAPSGSNAVQYASERDSRTPSRTAPIHPAASLAYLTLAPGNYWLSGSRACP